jgi:general secretion pathway protein E
MLPLPGERVPLAVFEDALAERLVEDAALDRDGVLRARAAADLADKRLDQALLDLGLVGSAKLEELLRTHFGVVEALPAEHPPEPVLSEALAATYLAQAKIVPLRVERDTITLAMVDPFDDFAARAIALKTNRAVLRRRISQAGFEVLFERLYGVAIVPAEAPAEADTIAPVSADLDILKDAASDAPVVRFVHDAVRAAVAGGASDIHLRPSRKGAEMLFRVGGHLVPRPAPDTRLYASIISRLKILANLDIAERRLPQDGRLRINVAGRPVDIRISTMPHVHGEAAVMRLLSRDLAASSLTDLGFSRHIAAGLERLFTATDGLILVTGPTGSGKTTTLHAALKQLIRPELNVVTIEDPVEYRVEGAAQIQVDEKIGLTFPRVLRSLLRQDPDIILVGEIRDGETARIAVQAALTGHLVLATLHTNSAPAAIPRLVDMGIEPYLLSAVLRGVLAQRLVRRRCSHARSADATAACPQCSGTGQRGRIAVGELLIVEPAIVGWLSAGLDLSQERQGRLAALGYRPLKEDAEARATAGDISREDLHGLIDVD